MNISEVLQETVDFLVEWGPVLIPLVIIQIGFFLFAAIDIGRKKQTRTLSPIIWVIIICCVNTIGPVLYFIFGRSDSIAEEDEDYKNY